MALSEFPTVAELTKLAETHGDVEVTRDDSLKSGNCSWGTDEFIETHFKRRKHVTVRDLVRYIEDSGVQSVLAYKFRQLEAGEKKEE